MTLAQLHYAITISEMGSLNKASEVLYVAQPSLTSAIKELEKELGIVIFNRSGKGVTPKELNNLVIHRAKLWLDAGHIFGRNASQFQRMVLACTRETLKQALPRLEAAVHR